MARLRGGKLPRSRLDLMLRSSEFLVTQRIRDVPMRYDLRFSHCLRRSQLLLEPFFEGLSAESAFDTFRSRMRRRSWSRIPPRNTDEYSSCVLWMNTHVDAKCSFFFTSGNSLLYGPEDAMMGDLIVFARGVSLPMMLRPMGNRHRFVGFAYMEGIDMENFSREVGSDELSEIVLL